MNNFELNSVLHFNNESQHPDSKIVGIDNYDFNADDGINRKWKSYTLIPVNEKDRKAPYERWYIVDLPDLGLSFVKIVNQSDLPSNLDIEPKLTGHATMKTIGDGELGTGESDLITYWDNAISPPQMYAEEVFKDNSQLFFKTTPLVCLKP